MFLHWPEKHFRSKMSHGFRDRLQNGVFNDVHQKMLDGPVHTIQNRVWRGICTSVETSKSFIFSAFFNVNVEWKQQKKKLERFYCFKNIVMFKLFLSLSYLYPTLGQCLFTPFLDLKHIYFESNLKIIHFFLLLLRPFDKCLS